MSATTLLPFIPIPEGSQATPGLFNSRLGDLQQNIVSVNSTVINPSILSETTWAAITLVANSNSSSYIRLVDSSAQRSSYRIGSFDGGTDDGLNIWDESGSTMIVSFSKQSVRFYQQVVGPVFDVGGALASTLNAATFGTGEDSRESRIQAAISAATAQGIARVYMPANMLPYSAASISFDTRVQMVREGGDWSVDDVKAYGASGSTGSSAASAVQAAVNRAYEGSVAYCPPGFYPLGNSGVSITRRLAFRGAGMSATTLIYNGTDGAVIVREPTTDRSVIEGFAIDGQQNANPSVVGLSLMSNANCVVRNVYVTGIRGAFPPSALGRAFQILPDATGTRGFFHLFDTCRANEVGYGFALENNGSGVPSANIILNPDLISCDSVGIWVKGSITFGVTIIGGACQNNGWDGIQLEGFHHTVLGTDSEQNGGVGVRNLTGTAKLFLNAGSLDGNVGGPTAGISLNESVTQFYPGVERVDIGPHLSVGTLSVGSTITSAERARIVGDLRVTGQTRTSSASIDMVVNDIRFGSDSFTSVAQAAFINDRGDSLAFYRFLTNEGGGFQERVKISSKGVGVQAGSAIAPTFNFEFGSEASLGWYRSGASTMALSYGTLLVNGPLWATSGVSAKGSILSSSYVSSDRTVMAGGLWGSGLSIGGTGSLIPAISSTSSRVAAFVVQGSSSSFTHITWAAVQPGDLIQSTVLPDAAASSISSGLIPHSHCTVAGRFEFRLSNVSTLAQQQSAKTWFFIRTSPF